MPTLPLFLQPSYIVLRGRGVPLPKGHPQRVANREENERQRKRKVDEKRKREKHLAREEKRAQGIDIDTTEEDDDNDDEGNHRGLDFLNRRPSYRLISCRRRLRRLFRGGSNSFHKRYTRARALEPEWAGSSAFGLERPPS